MVVSLPQDVILFEIITRVPTKFAVRFKCVSKQWNSFLASDRFKEMHSDRILLKDYLYPHLEDRKLLLNYDTFDYGKHAETFYTIDCESPPDNAPCRRPLPQFVVAPPLKMHILTSFHGLVCLSIAEYDIILWNPVTTEYKRLSKPSNPDHMECYKGSGKGHGLYYCSGEDDYKLLVVTRSGNAYIYSLKSDSWRKLDSKPPFQKFCWRPAFYLNKNLYFPDNVTGSECSMRFDTEAKRFHKIKNPPVFDGNSDTLSTAFTVQKGSIHLCVMYRDTCTIELWKFIADADIWRMVVTCQLLPNHGIRLSPLHLLNNGNLLVLHYKIGGYHMCQVDLTKKKYTKDKKDGRKSKDKHKSKGNYHDEHNLLYYCNFTVGWPRNVIYTETFVSPHRYTK